MSDDKQLRKEFLEADSLETALKHFKTWLGTPNLLPNEIRIEFLNLVARFVPALSPEELSYIEELILEFGYIINSGVGSYEKFTELYIKYYKTAGEFEAFLKDNPILSNENLLELMDESPHKIDLLSSHAKASFIAALNRAKILSRKR